MVAGFVELGGSNQEKSVSASIVAEKLFYGSKKVKTLVLGPATRNILLLGFCVEAVGLRVGSVL